MPDNAFVICQVGLKDSDVRARADEIFDYLVKPEVEHAGLAPTRSDRDPTPGQVTAQIIRAIVAAKVVVADLTGRNPNVYYELGVAHSFGKPVVIIVDEAKSLSFDTSNERVIEIGTNERLGVAEAEKAKRKLRETLRLVLADNYVPASLVSEAAGTQSLHELAPDNPVAQELAYVRDRLELVVRQTAGSKDVERVRHAEARSLFTLLSQLGEAGRLTTDDLESVDFDFDSVPDDNDLRTALSRLIPDPPLRPAVIADDDIPF